MPIMPAGYDNASFRVKNRHGCHFIFLLSFVMKNRIFE
ncbi:hypothetical protein BN1221_02498c [Brenneria goodwinii]|uniref:Uncharacterized protein n=1 Tax=Brenneria goodwinii TaxID=1109412 RepID=A0A0G4JWJ0_9GAMM|nr:hypothetical protein BN1221_02498c [Brenneria goodwinii]